MNYFRELTLDILIGREGHEATLKTIRQSVALGNEKLAYFIIKKCINAAALRHRDYLQWNVGILSGQNAKSESETNIFVKSRENNTILLETHLRLAREERLLAE